MPLYCVGGLEWSDMKSLIFLYKSNLFANVFIVFKATEGFICLSVLERYLKGVNKSLSHAQSGLF